MRIELRNLAGKRLGHVQADTGSRPARVPVIPIAARPIRADVFLRWDEAIDDAGSLRKCVVCGCEELYVRKNMPQVTPFIILLAFIGALVAALGLANHPATVALLILLLIVDVATLFLARRYLHCYRCRSTFMGAQIARYMRPWDRGVADRMRVTEREASTLLPTVLTGAVPMQGAVESAP